jgi:hypothetical protein
VLQKRTFGMDELKRVSSLSAEEPGDDDCDVFEGDLPEGVEYEECYEDPETGEPLSKEGLLRS